MVKITPVLTVKTAPVPTVNDLTVVFAVTFTVPLFRMTSVFSSGMVPQLQLAGFSQELLTLPIQVFATRNENIEV